MVTLAQRFNVHPVLWPKQMPGFSPTVLPEIGDSFVGVVYGAECDSCGATFKTFHGAFKHAERHGFTFRK